MQRRHVSAGSARRLGLAVALLGGCQYAAMRFVTYNLLSLASFQRIGEIATNLRAYHVVGL